MHAPDMRHDLARARAKARLHESTLSSEQQRDEEQKPTTFRARALLGSGAFLIRFGKCLQGMSGQQPVVSPSMTMRNSVA